MRTSYLLLFTLCLLLSEMASGGNFLTGLGHRSDHYNCVSSGGQCLYSACPIFTKIQGTCYGGKAKCCK
ncbi:DEFB1 isoform 1 [Pan troglodytes]|uniref:Beta-defensin 1 n=3 Tax=Pan TaxID=9596 RepID=DEFB1_PANTR|nr:beta-defensin 1 [Pan paniscus]P60023.2 RecName: Full=Beta-defensin 1; Short=BD-1; AltName: Full=Defensin, beta 1; AltName: Full=cBD1; Flags: Precursor [Pan troglodytes]AAK61462.1 DEFB1-like protein [Pan troglodytes]PNI23074.1 DEFB1 isoform 1 [Pan troglodytes]CAL68980.1 beta defensin 1 [Pan troglodytes]